MTVPFEQMDLSGAENDHLGRAYRVIYSSTNGKHSVLSAVPMSDAESFDTAKVDTDRDTVEIGGVKYCNHYITGYPHYDAQQMLKWIEKIDAMEG
jgi:hypothetical protein